MPSPIYRFDGAEFLGTTPEAAPAASAFVEAYRRSAVVSTMTELFEQDTIAIPVSDAGDLAADDLLRIVGRDYPDYQLSVVSINAERTVVTAQNYGAYVALAPGEKLSPTGDAPALYRDANLAHAYGDVIPRTDSAGRWEFYAASPALDVFVSGGGLGGEVHHRARAGFPLARATSMLDVRDYASIQAAIDALPAMGGTVFIPAGVWSLSETLYTPCDRPCHLLGEGSNHEGDKGTVLVWTTNTGLLRVRGNDSSVRNLVLRNDSGGSASEEHEGYGIHIGRRDVVDAHPHPGTSTTATEYAKGGRHPLCTVQVEDVVVIGAPGWGLTIPGFGNTQSETPEHGRVEASNSEEGTLSFWIHVNRTKIIKSKRYGGIFVGTGCTTIYFRGGACLYHGRDEASATSRYAYIRGASQVVFEQYTFEGTSPLGTGAAGTTAPWVRLVATEAIVFDTVWFENDPHHVGDDQTSYSPEYFLLLETRNRSVSIRNPLFARHGLAQGYLRCLYCQRDGVHGLTIEQPYAMTSAVMATREGEEIVWQPIDRDAMVFNGGSGGAEDNTRIVLLGAGMAEKRPEYVPGVNDPPMRIHLTHSNAPADSVLASPYAARVPFSPQSDRLGTNPNNDEMIALEGGIALEELAPGSVESRSLVYSYGDTAKWRLACNVPSVPISGDPQPEGSHEWANGDLVFHPTAMQVLMRVGGTWQLLKQFE